MSQATARKDPVPTTRGAGSIPRTFHHIWFGDSPALDYLDTWHKCHPEWNRMYWGADADWTWMENYDLFAQAGALAPGFEGQFKSDIARYEILRHYGGVYVDYDFECQRSLDWLLDNAVRTTPVQAFAAWEQQDVWVNNAIMGAVPDHPLLRALCTRLRDRVGDTRSSGRPAVMTGPQYLTKVYRDVQPPNTVVFPTDMFYPYAYDELGRKSEEFPQAYAIHHWNNQRRLRHAY